MARMREGRGEGREQREIKKKKGRMMVRSKRRVERRRRN